MGDLHPGGAPATEKILRRLTELGVRRVLEVGAGMGNTTARMATLGWDVTAIEPDPILHARLRQRAGATARCEEFLHHRPASPYDAIIAESVFFQMDLAQAFAHARALLKPGGCLAFIEAVWTDRINAALARELHENTARLFGMAVGSREPLMWKDWSRQLEDSGFETLYAELLPRGSAGAPPTVDRSASILAMVRDPRLVLWRARYRLRKRISKMPAGVQESWMFVGRSPHRPEELLCEGPSDPSSPFETAPR
jgi:SAM-dependent methyltransferase